MNTTRLIIKDLICCGNRQNCNGCSYRTQRPTKCFDLIKIAAAEELKRLDEEVIMLRKMNAGLTVEKEKLKERLEHDKDLRR